MIYSYSTGFQTVSTSSDLLTIVDDTTHIGCKLCRVAISSNESGFSQGLQIQLMSFSTGSVGTGGVSLSEDFYISDDLPVVPNATRNTTALHTGTSRTLYEDCFDHQMGWVWEPLEELIPSIGYHLVVRLPTAPSPAVMLNVSALVKYHLI